MMPTVFTILLLRYFPRLKAINYELEATKKQVSAARGNFAPRLVVGGSIYTGYYKVISEDE